MPIVAKYRALLVNTIHDEVIIEVRREDAADLMDELNAVWQKRFDLLPGARVNGDWNSGDTWFEAK
jgi:DNA polymerase I-like protein with 3'-5' exonuclease and polymerase domains